MSRDRLAQIERIEARLVELPRPIDVPLSRLEQAELRELEREHRERFPVDVADMDEATLDDFLSYMSGADGTAPRLASPACASAPAVRSSVRLTGRCALRSPV